MAVAMAVAMVRTQPVLVATLERREAPALMAVQPAATWTSRRRIPQTRSPHKTTHSRRRRIQSWRVRRRLKTRRKRTNEQRLAHLFYVLGRHFLSAFAANAKPPARDLLAFRPSVFSDEP